MASNRIYYYKFRILLTVAAAWLLFGCLLAYNILEVEKRFLTNTSPFYFIIIFGITGFIISAGLVFYLKSIFRHYPLGLSILLKTLLSLALSVLIAVISFTIYFLFSNKGNLQQYVNSIFRDFFFTSAFLIFLIDLSVMTLLSIVLLEITDKYGPGGFWRMMRGEYNKPKIENRIFVFLDINNATTIAEHLGHEKYFRLLKDFFADITQPVLANGGEIYQYVGDEVVLSWSCTPANKIKCFKFIKQAFVIIQQKEKKYLHRYGTAPSFKTGIHAGEVTAGYIGIIKKDLIYSGDTLNTTARIRGKCNELKKSFVLSGDFIQDFQSPASYRIIEIGEMEFKGRKEKEKLYSLSFDEMK